jgi:OHCU decarboxylase
MQKPHQLSIQSKSLFLQTFEALYEHSPWVIERVFEKVCSEDKYDDLQTFHHLLSSTMLSADDELKMALILAHPRLAGKKAQQNELTDFSTEEQKSAGLSACSDEELAYITNLNEQYYKRFNFDFIMAVKGKSKEAIFKAFEQRLSNEREQEISTALEQINQIAWLRIQALYE